MPYCGDRFVLLYRRTAAPSYMLCTVYSPSYKSCLMYRNKLVLSQLPSPLSTVVTPIRLYPLYCTLYIFILHAGLNSAAHVALSFADFANVRVLCEHYFVSVSDSRSPLRQLRSVQPIGYNFCLFLKRFRSDFASKSTNNSILLETGRSYHSTLFFKASVFLIFELLLLYSFNCADSAVQFC